MSRANKFSEYFYLLPTLQWKLRKNMQCYMSQFRAIVFSLYIWGVF